MRNTWRKTLVTVGIAVALAVGPGIGMANAAPLQLPEVPSQVIIEPPAGPEVPAAPEVPAVPSVPAIGLGWYAAFEAALDLLVA
jgi:hypothetical protein